MRLSQYSSHSFPTVVGKWWPQHQESHLLPTSVQTLITSFPNMASTATQGLWLNGRVWNESAKSMCRRATQTTGTECLSGSKGSGNMWINRSQHKSFELAQRSFTAQCQTLGVQDSTSSFLCIFYVPPAPVLPYSLSQLFSSWDRISLSSPDWLPSCDPLASAFPAKAQDCAARACSSLQVCSLAPCISAYITRSNKHSDHLTSSVSGNDRGNTERVELRIHHQLRRTQSHLGAGPLAVPVGDCLNRIN